MGLEYNDIVVSVVVPTFNSGETISDCLQSIRSQSYTNTEIIVIDRFSIDTTISFANKYADTVLESGEKRSKARNIAAEKSRGKYVMFIDSDMELEQNVIEESVSICESGTFSAIIVPELSFGRGFWSKCIALEKRIYLGNELIESPCFFNKDRFFEIKGYDEGLEAGEDWDIHRKLSDRHFTVGRTSSIIWHNEGLVSLRKMFLKKYHYGRTIHQYTAKNQIRARRQLSPSRLIRSDSMIMMISGSPKYGFGLIFLKSIEFAGLVLGSRS